MGRRKQSYYDLAMYGDDNDSRESKKKAKLTKEYAKAFDKMTKKKED